MANTKHDATDRTAPPEPVTRVAPERPPADDVVDEMERESFPASDAPSTWAGRENAGGT